MRRAPRPFAAAVAAILVTAAGGAAAQPPGKRYDPGAFTGVELSGSAQVRFEQGEDDHVVVFGDAAVQDALVIEVRNGTLQVHQSGNWKFWDAGKLQMTVVARELRRVSISGASEFVANGPVRSPRLEVQLSGAGRLRFDDLVTDRLRFGVSGAGDGRFAGRAGELRIDVSGRGDFLGGRLQSTRAEVRVSGIGNVRVWATDTLRVGVSGIGTVDYWGSPNVDRSVSGMATLKARGPGPAPE